MLELAVTARDPNEKPDALRAQGRIPAVFYGPKEASTPISIDGAIFEKMWKEAGESTIVTLTGIGAKKDTLIHMVELHPVSDRVQHADFYVLEAGKKIEVAIPIEFVGTAPAEKLGGVVVKVLHEIEITVNPSELPQHFTIDLSALENIGDHITAGDIVLPPSATLNIEPNETVVSITEMQEEAEEEAPAEAAEGAEASDAAAAEGEAAPAAE